MANAVLPNPSARAEWLFAGIIDRALHHWGHVPALDGGPGDHDLDDLETDTPILDDDGDTVSLASCMSESVWPSSLLLPGLPWRVGGIVVGRQWVSHAMSRAHSVSGQYTSSRISTSRTVSRTTGSQGNTSLTFWRWRTTSFSGVSQRSRTPQRFRGSTEASALTSCVISTPLPICRSTARFSLHSCWT